MISFVSGSLVGAACFAGFIARVAHDAPRRRVAHPQKDPFFVMSKIRDSRRVAERRNDPSEELRVAAFRWSIFRAVAAILLSLLLSC